ncbi:hypothetical protein FGB62_87g055 [Gracilaria domingensis]|nr:hypothetical protein FGB62_87g055 [Gracilaria domingensis]
MQDQPEPLSSPPTHASSLRDLPEDVQQQLVSLLNQADQAHLATSCQYFHHLVTPLLRRIFRCVTCQAQLFEPKELALYDTQPSSPRSTFGPCSKLAKRTFFQLTERNPTRDVTKLGMVLDHRRGAANFHVLRHLMQTVYKDGRFPLPQQLQCVQALRCESCGVFVGFRHSDGGSVRDFVHHDFVELSDSKGRLMTLSGRYLPPPEGIVNCANPQCRNVLFDRDDMLPWSHVLASSRLTDMNAYLEWDHSWAGAATADQPAFFVKRLRDGSVEVRHVRTEHLRQGHMVVGDVHCSQCDRHIGWKLLSEVAEGEMLHNYDQIGRFGIIRGAVAPTEPRNLHI